ncbi:MATE family efflux transporter [Adlercreutzia sp. R21]|uniref:MATE family efflux transporter n=1 Tax=Adlercreutzia wanghongyangiae TaxID=3111451 RepID=UPI002DB8CF81|nr:MATE family efflux transporter [Adlercreutzia sp. R21]MEC4184880.1 MATE family efflux transporter [Adlercreutzia sp. R21]
MGEKGTAERLILIKGSDCVGALLARFAGPVMVGMLVTRLCLIVDGVLVGQALGQEGVAAITAAAPFVTLLNALVMLVGDGAAAVMALRFGAGDKLRAGAVMGNALVMFAALSALAVVGAGCWAPLLLSFTGVETAVLEDATAYLTIVLGGTVGLCFSLGVDTFLRVCGFPLRTLAVQVLCAGVNVMAGYVFVIGLGWGVRGAAWATVVSQLAALALTTVLLRRADMPVRLRWSDCRPDGQLMARSLALGLPSFIVRSTDAAVALLTNFLVVAYGAEGMGANGALAVAGLVSRVTQFAMVPAIGIAVGARPLIGFACGGADARRVRRLVRCALRAGTVVLVGAWVAVQLGAPWLASSFGLAGDAAVVGAMALRVGLGALPLLMVRIMGTNYFQAAGQARTATLLTFCQQCVFLLPLIALTPLVLPAATAVSPLMAVFWGMLVADVLSTTLVAAFLARSL